MDTKNEGPSELAMAAASRALAMLQTVSDPDFAYLARRVAVEIDRVRREARAEAFEEAKAQRKEIEELRREASAWSDGALLHAGTVNVKLETVTRERDALKAERDAERERCNEELVQKVDALKERDALKAEVEAMKADADKGDYIPTSMYLKRCEELRAAEAVAERVHFWERLSDTACAEVESWKAKAQKWEQDWGAARSKVFKLDAKVMALEAELERLKKGK